MSNRRLEWRVGLFVLISLGLGVALIISLSKGSFWFARTYDVLMKTTDVGGLIPNSAVLLSGVRVGSVESAVLAPAGDSVAVRLRISNRYKIHRDARFSIEQMGFLGDRFVSITPTADALPELVDGDQVEASRMFDIQEVARSASGFLQRTDEAVGKVNEIVERLNRVLFTESTLTNLAATIANVQLASERGLTILASIDGFVKTNSLPVSASLSNLVQFSEQLSQTATEFRDLISTNRPEVSSVIKNLESASSSVETLSSELQAGKGVIGALLKDPQLDQQFRSLVRDLSLVSSNLNRYGLLYKPPPIAPPKSTPLYPGRTPFSNQ